MKKKCDLYWEQPYKPCKVSGRKVEPWSYNVGIPAALELHFKTTQTCFLVFFLVVAHKSSMLVRATHQQKEDLEDLRFFILQHDAFGNDAMNTDFILAGHGVFILHTLWLEPEHETNSPASSSLESVRLHHSSGVRWFPSSRVVENIHTNSLIVKHKKILIQIVKPLKQCVMQQVFIM